MSRSPVRSAAAGQPTLDLGARLRRRAGALKRHAERRAVVLRWQLRGRLPFGGHSRPEIADVPLPEAAPRRSTRVAVILDPFSELAFRYEWDQVLIGPDDWRQRLSAAPPELLFVESAWNGNDGRWRLHMTGAAEPSAELQSLVRWCQERGIPTVFWNKEDPPNYDRFIATARLFDRVFTVDADRFPAYRQDLGHDRVELLTFAAQPRIHNPVRRGRGKVYDVAFAGTWFAEKHPDRRRQMEYLLGPAREFGLHIWSRMQTEDRRYRFPAGYVGHVVGSLPYERMVAAYTAYKVFLNVNSVTTSATMCSRRLFELSAAQTAVVSTPAASIEPFFGTDIEVVHDAEEARQTLAVLLEQPEYRDRLALRAHRRVYDAHLYQHRVAQVLTSVGLPVAPAGPDAQPVSVIVPTIRPGQLEHVLAAMGRQSHRQLQVVLVLHGFDAPDGLQERARALGVPNLVVVRADRTLTLGACLNLGLQAADGTLVAKVDDDNVYGTHYLTDLVRALDYSGASVTGKWAHFVHLQSTGATLLRFAASEHRFTDLVQGGTLLTTRELARELAFDDLPRQVDTTFLRRVHRGGGTVYSSDRFNFVSVRSAEVGGHTWKITDKELLTRSSRLLFYGDPSAHAEA